jgi:ribosomal protein S19E (S16A)
MSYRDPTAYYWHCLAIAETMPPGESRDWWFIRAGSIYLWDRRFA